MLRISNASTRARLSILAASLAAVSLALWGGAAIAQQNKDSVKVPDGLALSEFKATKNGK